MTGAEEPPVSDNSARKDDGANNHSNIDRNIIEFENEGMMATDSNVWQLRGQEG